LGRRLRAALVCAVVGTAQLAVAAGAPAQARSLPTGPSQACPIAHIRLNVNYSCAGEFVLRGSNGYKITVSADPEAGGTVQLTAEGHGGAVDYLAHGRANAKGIEARFGRLGRISVRFHPSGRSRHLRVPKRCLAKRPPVVSSRLGWLVGTIRFRGERGFTQVSAHRAPGGFGDPLTNTPTKLECESRESAAEHKRELESAILDGAPRNREVAFSAFPLFGSQSHPFGAHGNPAGRPDLFLALAFERSGKMSILRSAAALGGSEDFLFDDALTSATVTPPAPFTGTGTFQRRPDGTTSWTGSLSVALPGLGSVGLTGGKAELATVADLLKQAEERHHG
jgi:hypothetical protein